MDLERELLTAAVQRAADAFVVSRTKYDNDIEGRQILHVNPSFTRIFGYEESETVGRSLAELIFGPLTNLDAVARSRTAMLEGNSSAGEAILYDRGGNPLNIEYEIYPIRSESASIVVWMGVFRDITLRKRQEAEIQRQLERLSLISSATSDLLWDWPIPVGDIWWSDNFASVMRIEGTAPTTFEGWLDFVHPDDRERVANGVAEFISTGQALRHGEYRVVRGDGTVRTMVSRSIMVRGEDGEPRRRVGSLLDVTEHRLLEEQVRRSQRMEAIGKLTGGIAHDFNNLLTIVLGNTEVLRDVLDYDPDLAILADLTIKAAERGALLTNKLLAFGRRQALKTVSIDPGELFEEAALLVERTLRSDIRVTTSNCCDGWHACADRGQLELALLNLALNAQDAMPAGGNLRITASPLTIEEARKSGETLAPGDYVAISVADTGCGMSEAVMLHACEPFFTTKGPGEGSGLGLSMVHGFASQSGGDLRIQSEAGNGTEVTIILPCAEPEAGVAEPVPAAARAADLAGLRVLVVEDEPSVLRHIRSQLIELGCEVSEADTGAAALELLDGPSGFDFLLTDIVMPGDMNGFELARRAREIWPDLNLLFMSGYDLAARQDTENIPEAPLLSKPFRRAQLEEAIRGAVRTR